MKSIKYLSIVAACVLLAACGGNKDETYNRFANPFVGAADNGHCNPGAAVPFGNIQVGPQTGNFTWAYTSGYQNRDSSIMGFSHNRLSGTGCHDLGDVMIMPFTGDADREHFASPFDKAREEAEPGYYAVVLSTDKAVNPTNIMGCTKRLAEIYTQSLGLAIAAGKHEGRTTFITTRFGNVLGSNGSVIPRFREQIAAGGPVPVTHPEINRFFMSIPEACRLVMEAATLATGAQIFIFDMGEPVKIDTLARRMITLAGFIPDKDIEVKYTGLRPGEKLYEELLANDENTIPTKHTRIRIAKVREYDYDEAAKVADRLCDLAREVRIPEMVQLMKATVPEYISSANSRFAAYDKK